jgi:DNA uptake protein ComE-like DNA-binding protein
MRPGITLLLLIAVDVCLGHPFLAAIPQTPPGHHSVPPEEMRVDINHATIEELLKVPGMTRTWAGRILRFRPYRTKIDLLDRGIVNSKVYSHIKDFIIAHREKQ